MAIRVFLAGLQLLVVIPLGIACLFIPGRIQAFVARMNSRGSNFAGKQRAQSYIASNAYIWQIRFVGAIALLGGVVAFIMLVADNSWGPR